MYSISYKKNIEKKYKKNTTKVYTISCPKGVYFIYYIILSK